MKIQLKNIYIRDLFDGFVNKKEDGIVGYGGKLNIRPAYQREFVYKEKQQIAVIESILSGFPINVMYWGVNQDNGYEIIDGQQRTLSRCNYLIGTFGISGQSSKPIYFHNMDKEYQDKILNYQIMVYICEGSVRDKLKWFETINIAGEKLTSQELRNAVYSGSWVTDAKKYFSKNQCAAYQIAKDYISGNLIRQDFLETAIKWISNDNIDEYMAKRQHDQNAGALWRYFQGVISWIETTFPVKRKKLMKGVDWGSLYNRFKDNDYSTDELESEVSKLIMDDDVQNKKGIYPYILTRNEKHLSIRSFSDSMKQKVYEKQNGICPVCKKHYSIYEMEADHIIPWSKGGKTNEDNCQMLCVADNRIKSNK